MGFRDCLPCFRKRKPKAAPLPPVKIIQIPEEKASSSPRSETTQTSVRNDNDLSHNVNPEEYFIFTAKDVWESAYEQLRNEKSTGALVQEYEALLRSEFPSFVSSGNESGCNLALELADLDPNTRQTMMDRLAQRRLDEIKKSSTGREVFLKVSAVIDQVKTTVGSALSACPPASVGWTVTCLLVTPATQYAEQTNANQDGLRYVISKMPWYTQLIDLLNADAWKSTGKFNELKNVTRMEIVELYKLLIEYQLRSFDVENHPLSMVARNTANWDDWGGKIEKIKGIEEQLMVYIDTYSKVDFKDKFDNLLQKTDTIGKELSNVGNILQDTRNIAQNANKKKMIEKYKPDPTEINLTTYHEYTNAVAKIEADTGRCVLHHGLYRHWMERDNGVLILAANPGTGKSVLAKHLRDNLSERGDQVVCSFFFKDNTLGQTKPNIALCKILHDLLKQVPRINSIEDKLDKLDREEIQPDSKELWNIINIASQDPVIGGVAIILDALDESDHITRESLFERISNFHSRFPNAKVKFFLTTRPLNIIFQKFKIESILNLNEDTDGRKSLRGDIAKVTSERLQEFADKNDISSSKVRNKLLSILEQHEDQTYLFIELLFQYLEKQPLQFDRDWIQIFESLPTNVLKAYRAFLDKVDQKNREHVTIIVKIVLAATRPLTVMEMKIAFKLQLKYDRDCETIEDLELWSDQSFSGLIREACGFFFDIVGGRIYFIHQTVKDYLLSPEAKVERPDWLREIDIKDCHKALAESCMRYLSLPFIEHDPRFLSIEDYMNSGCISQSNYHQWCKENFEFGEYGFSNWIIHFRQSSNEDEDPSVLLSHISARYSERRVSLAVSIFCCSALPSNVDAKAFLDVLPMEYPDRDEILSALSQSFIENYFKAGGVSDLVYGITLAEQVLERTVEDHPKRARRLKILSGGLQLRYSRTHKHEALEIALRAAKEATERVPLGHPGRALILDQYAQVLYMLYRLNNKIQVINKAVDAANEAFDIVNDTQHDMAHCLITIATVLGERGAQASGIEDLDESIKAAEKAVEILHDNPAYQAVALNHVVTKTFLRYEREKKEEYLYAAVEVARKVVSVNPPGSPGGVINFKNLAVVLEKLYDYGNDEKYLLEAINAARTAAKLLEDDHPDKARYLEEAQRLLNRKERIRPNDNVN